MIARDARELDLVLFGATGYIGGLTARELAADPSASKLRWALAGRDPRRLAAVRAELAAIDPRLASMPVVRADAGAPSTVADLAARARVVCSTVGPYALYGSGLVAACARSGTDYCDIAGERQWIREMVVSHHRRAQRSGARLVHCCGFDSVPSDLGTLVLQRYAIEQFGRPCQRVSAWFGPWRGGFGGGGANSALESLAASARDRRLRRQLADPDFLAPGAPAGPALEPDLLPVRFDRQLGAWTGPFGMAAINTRVVRRSHALLGHSWGDGFRYREGAAFSGGIGGLYRALRARMGLAVASLLSRSRAALWVARRLSPAPGTGPTPAERARGHYRVQLIGELDGEPIARVELSDRRDPACGATALMLAQSALVLARGESDAAGGSLTPAVGLGAALAARLVTRGTTIRAERLVIAGSPRLWPGGRSLPRGAADRR